MVRKNEFLRGGWRAGALAAALFLVGWGAHWMSARAGEGLAFGGGGDSVGTLPMMAPPWSGPGSQGDYGDNPALFGPAAPAFALEGKLDTILACITDAFPTGPDGAYAIVPLANDRVRMEFYGRATVILDRARFHGSKVRGEVMVGSSFLGGIAEIRVADQLRARHALHLGASDLKLRALDNAGVLQQEFVWHAISRDDHHRVLEVNTVGASIRIEQRD